jgi:hypothetical protein
MPYGILAADQIQSSVTGVSLGAGNATRFKNRLINSDMAIDQRNAGASVTITATAYTLDRWQAYCGGVSSKFSVQQNSASVTPPVGFANYLGAVSLSAYSVSSTDRFGINQSIEGLNAADLGWGTANAKTVTLSFWVRSSLTGTFGGSIQNYAATRSYPFSYTINSANTWEYETITIPGDTSGTWLTTNSGFATINLAIGTGSTYSGTAGAWATADYRSTTGATSVVGTNGATFYITGVQLEVGSIATGFEEVDYTTQLQMCQRYAASTFPIGTAWGQNKGAAGCCLVGSTGATGYGCQIPWRYPVNLRATPTTITTYNPVAANANVRNFALTADRTINTLGFSQNGSTGLCFTADTASDTAGMAYGVHYSVDAEL